MKGAFEWTKRKIFQRREPLRNASVLMVISLLLIACKDNSTNLSLSNEFLTAKQRFDAVNSYVNSNHTGLRLLSASAKSVSIDGKAAKWSYCYLDTSLGAHPTYYFHATIDEIGFDSTAQLLIGPSVNTLRWFDSDSAMIFANSHGGSQYVSQYPNATITASLGQSLSPNPVASWRVVYQGGSLALGLIIDANSGALLGQTK